MSFSLLKHIEEQGIKDTALIRLEQLCPFPTKELQDEVSRYPHAKSKNLHKHSDFFFFREIVVLPLCKDKIRATQLANF